MNNRQYMPFCYEWNDTLDQLNDKQFRKLFKALMRYSESGEAPQLSGIESIAFGLIKPQIDRYNEAYCNAVERNRTNGKKGGRPKKDTDNDDENQMVNSENPENQIVVPEGSENPVVISVTDEITQKPSGFFENPKNPIESNRIETNQIETNRESTGDVAAAPARPRFVKPSVEDVNAYCSEAGYHIDTDRFIAYYDSNGWKVGRNPMKDWRAAIRSWASRDNAMPDKGKPQPVMPDYTPPPDGVCPWAMSS